MHVRTRATHALLCAAALSLTGAAHIAGAHELKPSHQGDYQLVSGGLVADEVAQLDQLAPRYQIQLMFRNDGDTTNVSGVKVRLRDTKGELVVETTTLGPYLFINPPAGGRYTIEAEYHQQAQSRTRDLTGRRYLQMHFDFGTLTAPSPETSKGTP